MKKTSAMAAVLAAGLFGAMAAPGSASQYAETAVPSASRSKTIDPQEFESRAKSLFSNPKRYDEAIKLFLKAADTREVGDPVRVKDVIMASRLAYYREDMARSLSLMQRAADEAAATGDVLTAAHAYMDAAFLARGFTNADVVVALVKKAELLAYSPLISELDKEGILVRIRSA
jgi:hypothetical protein